MAELWDGTLAALVGGVVGALSGGGVSHFVAQSGQRTQRKQGQIDLLESKVDDLKEAAMAYWRTSGRDNQAERFIISKLDAVASGLERLRDRGYLSSEKYEVAEDARSRLWEAVTGGTFQTRGRAIDTGKAEAIRRLCDEVVSQLN